MPTKYRVIKGAVGHADVIFAHGSVIPDGALNERQINSLLAEGVIKAEIEAEAIAPPAVPAPAPVTAPGGSASKPWNVSPKKLAGKALDELHVMIAEIDPKRSPPETVEDCVALLSRDFKVK